MHKEYISTSIKGCKDWEVPHGLSILRKIYCLNILFWFSTTELEKNRIIVSAPSVRNKFHIPRSPKNVKFIKGSSYWHNKKFSIVALNPIAAPYLERLLSPWLWYLWKEIINCPDGFFARYQDTSIKGCWDSHSHIKQSHAYSFWLKIVQKV